MNIWRTAALVGVLLSACTSGETTQPVALRLSDGDGNPVANARLICHDTGELLGKTNLQGELSLEVAGQSTPKNGFMPNCQVAYFRTDNDQFGRHFWFARFVRGEPVRTKLHSVELLASND